MKNYEYRQSDLSRAVLAGLFAGIIGTFANLVFTAIYRGIAKFYSFTVLDVGTIIFGSTLLLIACGVTFYFFAHYLNKKSGLNLYRLVVFIITAALITTVLYVRFSGQTVPGEFKAMLIGTQVIIGGLAFFLIPYLFRHDSIIS